MVWLDAVLFTFFFMHISLRSVVSLREANEIVAMATYCDFILIQ